MKRAAAIIATVVVLGTAGLGVARAAAPRPIDPDNPLVRQALAGYTIAAEDEIGARGLRVWGQDRYETAVAISQSQFPDPQQQTIVFLASGQNFPDALAGGPAASLLGPLLLTFRDQLPSVTAAEISRLQPCAVIAFGGEAAISRAVIEQAQALTTRTCET